MSAQLPATTTYISLLEGFLGALDSALIDKLINRDRSKNSGYLSESIDWKEVERNPLEC